MELNKIYCGDVLSVLKQMPDNFVDCSITSPPYYNLRDYGTAKWEGGDEKCEHKVGRSEYPVSEKQKSNNGSLVHQARDICPKCGAKQIDEQIGLEETHEEYVSKLVEVFKEVRRVLKPTGTIWLNMGDSYMSRSYGMSENNAPKNNKTKGILKPKDLCGIPWRVAFALQADGWYLRQDIIWHKPNPMPESVTDRCTKSHEYIFLMSKSPKYYFDGDAIKEHYDIDGIDGWRGKQKRNPINAKIDPTNKASANRLARMRNIRPNKNGRNRRSVWTVTTSPFKEAHFATFPSNLIVPMIKAGCSEEVCNKCGKARIRLTERISVPTRPGRIIGTGKSGKEDDPNKQLHTRDPQRHIVTEIKTIGYTDCGCGEGFSPGVVLDPFMGAGTTAVVARKLGRNFIGIELNPKYIQIAEKRLANELGMFANAQLRKSPLKRS